MERRSLLTAVAIATLAVFLTGCSRSPVAPVTDTAAAPGAGTSLIIPDDPPPSDGGTPGSRTVLLATTDEGLLTVGRFTLWIRKNSLKMPASVTLSVTNPEAMECQIVVSPAQANDFQSPVILTANTTDVPQFDYNTAAMSTWDGAWELASSVVAHENQQNVVGHFSQLANVKLSCGDKWKNKLAG